MREQLAPRSEVAEAPSALCDSGRSAERASAVERVPAPTASGIKVLGAVALGHFTIDIFNSMGPVLLAFLRYPLAMSTGQLGFALGLYQFLAGSTQPIFGWLADRIGAQWMGAVSVLWTVTFVCLSVWSAATGGSFVLFVVLFSAAAVGSGAFHPHGTMHAGFTVAGRAATTTAVFFFGGQVGLASGPVLAGLALDTLGPGGIYLLGVAVCAVPLLMFIAMRGAPLPAAPAQPVPSADPADSHPLQLGVLTLLVGVFGLRAWAFIGTASFLPTLFQAQGWTATRQGVVTGLFWLGGGLGGVVAGGLADRWGRRKVVCLTTVVGGLLLYLLPVSEGTLALLVAVGCGAFLGAPHSVLMVMSQALLPVRRGLASGLALGYLFAMGAVASWIIGLLADRFALSLVLQGGAALALIAAALSVLLPSSRSD